MDFRVLKFRPAPRRRPAEAAPSASAWGHPAGRSRRDTAFFWAGTAVGELRVQRCDGCGTLRHPPGPMCPSCGA